MIKKKFEANVVRGSGEGRPGRMKNNNDPPGYIL